MAFINNLQSIKIVLVLWINFELLICHEVKLLLIRSFISISFTCISHSHFCWILVFSRSHHNCLPFDSAFNARPMRSLGVSFGLNMRQLLHHRIVRLNRINRRLLYRPNLIICNASILCAVQRLMSESF